MRKLSLHMPGPDWWTAIFSGILAVTAVGALWYARDQIKETREESEVQIKEARQQAQIQHFLRWRMSSTKSRWQHIAGG